MFQKNLKSSNILSELKFICITALLMLNIFAFLFTFYEYMYLFNISMMLLKTNNYFTSWQYKHRLVYLIIDGERSPISCILSIRSWIRSVGSHWSPWDISMYSGIIFNTSFMRKHAYMYLYVILAHQYERFEHIVILH